MKTKDILFHLKAIVREFFFDKEMDHHEKEHHIHEVMCMFNTPRIQKTIYKYVQYLQRDCEGPVYIDLEQFYDGDSLPFPEKSEEILDVEMDEYYENDPEPVQEYREEGQNFVEDHESVPEINVAHNNFLDHYNKKIYDVMNNLNYKDPIFYPNRNPICKGEPTLNEVLNNKERMATEATDYMNYHPHVPMNHQLPPSVRTSTQSQTYPQNPYGYTPLCDHFPVNTNPFSGMQSMNNSYYNVN